MIYIRGTFKNDIGENIFTTECPSNKYILHSGKLIIIIFWANEVTTFVWFYYTLLTWYLLLLLHRSRDNIQSKAVSNLWIKHMRVYIHGWPSRDLYTMIPYQFANYSCVSSGRNNINAKPIQMVVHIQLIVMNKDIDGQFDVYI